MIYLSLFLIIKEKDILLRKKMKTRILYILLIAFSTISCGIDNKDKAIGEKDFYTVEGSSGNILLYTFDKTKSTMTIVLGDLKEELTQQRAASGIWYANEYYDLRGKGNEIELTKDGELLFKTSKK